MMSQVDFDAMSDAELRQYLLQNRQDQAALEAHLDRLNRQSRPIIASPGDPDFSEKIQAAIRQKIEALENAQASNSASERAESLSSQKTG
jgi:hypothetical protein